ncbi:MAG: hypothetical protein OEZ68_09860 [Gammaproteobacteria bacterium]|nr:hypothetical protein [Gammaproteobacteria bacterium]MDH5801093.1 hypothetical protein [Gammaproteobacteria bacterium]
MRKLHIVAGVLSIPILVPIALYSIQEHNKGPFKQVIFIEDVPGANDRYVTFTPVMRSDPSIIMGETVGADFGKLHYRDCDGDGVKEAVVETDEFLELGDYKRSVRHVYKFVESNNMPQVKLISSEAMPEKDPEWIGREVNSKSISHFCDP